MNLKRFLMDLKEGIKSKIPLCCVLNFALDRFMENDNALLHRYLKEKEYCPCILHMKAYHQNKEKAYESVIQEGNIDTLFLTD